MTPGGKLPPDKFSDSISVSKLLSPVASVLLNRISVKTSKNESKADPDLVARVQRIVAHQLKKKPNDIKPTMDLQKDLGADSLDALEIVMTIEEEFKMQIPEEVARGVRTIQDIIDYVKLPKKK